MKPDTESLQLLQQLIQNACVNDLTADSGEEFRNVASLEAFFAAEIAQGKIKVTHYEPHPGRLSAVFHVAGQDPSAEPLTLMGHIDVVPVDEQHWTQPPFGGAIVGDRIYGRGSVDMLFITAAMAIATRDYAQNPGRGDLYFAALADEEARGGLGAAWFAEHAPEAFSWKNCLSETGGAHLPTADGSAATVLYVGEKGAAQRRLHVFGDAGHGSVPYQKESTIGLLSQVALRLAEFEIPVADSDTWQGFVRAFHFDPAIEQALLQGTEYEQLGGLAAYGHAISHLTIAQTVARAGKAINVLPSHGWLELDIRTLPGQDDDAVDALLREALGDLAPVVRIERLISEEATVSPAHTQLYDVLVDALHQQFPETSIVPVIASGGSDLRFARRRGGYAYGFAVHGIERTLGAVQAQLHSHDEYLHLEDYARTIAGYRYVVQRFLRAD